MIYICVCCCPQRRFTSVLAGVVLVFPLDCLAGLIRYVGGLWSHLAHLQEKPARVHVHTKMLQTFVTFTTNWIHSRRLNRSRILTGMLAGSCLSDRRFESPPVSVLYTNLRNPGRFPSIDTLNELAEANMPIHCFNYISYYYYSIKGVAEYLNKK